MERLPTSVKDRFQKGLSKKWTPEKRPEFWVMRLPRDVVRDTKPKGKVVIDAGTGRARFAIAFAKAGAERVVATDISPLMIKMARKEAEREGVLNKMEFGIDDMENLKYSANTFDIACSMGTTIHLPNPLKAVAELNRVCKVGGLVVINTVVAKKPLEGSHWKTLGEDEFLSLFEKNGLEIKTLRIYHQAGIKTYGMMACGLKTTS